MVCRFFNYRIAGQFSVCVYNFLETRSTMGEPQLADSIVLKHVALETVRPRAACDATARRRHKESPVSSNNPAHAQSERPIRTIAGVYENDRSNCKCRRGNNSIKRTDLVLVRCVQPATWYTFGLIGSMVCYLAERVTIPEIHA